MKKIFSLILVFLVTSCSTASQFGTGVNITFDPRTIGMQIDDTIMQKNLNGRLALADKKYFISIQSEVLDGRIFLSGKVDEPEEKIKITKMAWETKGVRSVKNAITIKGQSNFKSTAKDILITSQLRSALILNKKTKSKVNLFLISLEPEFLGSSVSSVVRVLLGGGYIIFFGLLYCIVFFYTLMVTGNYIFSWFKI